MFSVIILAAGGATVVCALYWLIAIFVSNKNGRPEAVCGLMFCLIVLLLLSFLIKVADTKRNNNGSAGSGACTDGW